jgi:hypothetical protein
MQNKLLCPFIFMIKFDFEKTKDCMLIIFELFKYFQVA